MQQKSHEKLVSENTNSETLQVKMPKSSIQEALYPKDIRDFSYASMQRALRALHIFKQRCTDVHEVVDVTLFYVECGIKIIKDCDGISEDFYIEMETALDDALLIINVNGLPLNIYQERLNNIVHMSKEWSDQIEYLVNIAVEEAKAKL